MYDVLASFYTVNDITWAFYFTVNSLIQMVSIKSMNQYYKFHHPLYKPAHICIENQLLITTVTVTVMRITIRHNRKLTTLKAVSYFKQKSKSRSEKLKLHLSWSLKKTTY